MRREDCGHEKTRKNHGEKNWLREDEPLASPENESLANRILCAGSRRSGSKPPVRRVGFRGPFGLRRRLVSAPDPHKRSHPRVLAQLTALSPISAWIVDRRCG